MRIKCPCCHAEYSLDAALDGQAGSELSRVLAELEPTLARPLLAYLGLFRSSSRPLSWDRALRLAVEALAMDANRAHLALGLSKTVTVLREKQGQGSSWKPLTNHNYLRRVLDEMPSESVSAVMVPEPPQVPERPQAPQTKTGQALLKLEAMKHGRK